MSEALERRAKWDRRFLDMAELVASWSKDPSTKFGAVIVRPDLTICSVGYNGFPRGVADLTQHLEDRAEKYERVIHAEVNAILSASESLRGYTIYIHPPGPVPSCARCTTCIIQAGITRVVHYHEPFTDDKPMDGWRASIGISWDMYRQAGVEVVSIGQAPF